MVAYQYRKTLPFGTRAEVVSESEKLIRLGREGSYIFLTISLG